MTDKHFHANVHVPGYLPAGDVPLFDTAEEAWSYLVGELERGWDGEGAASESLGEGLEIDGRYLEPHTAMHNMDQSQPGSVHLDGPSDTHLGWMYEVTACTETDCDDQ